MIKRNKEIREVLKQTGLKQWYLAELMGVSEQTLCRRLRVELPEEEKQCILQIIRENGRGE